MTVVIAGGGGGAISQERRCEGWLGVAASNSGTITGEYRP